MSNDARALETLIAHYADFLSFLDKRVARATAEDLLQEAFVRGVTRHDSLKDEASAVAWFYRLLRNALVDHYRRTGASERAIDAFAREIDEAIEPEVETRENPCGCVTRIASSLKPEYEQALTRIEVEGVSVKDYAAETGIQPSNAAVRVFRARKALERRVVTHCGACADSGCTDCTCQH